MRSIKKFFGSLRGKQNKEEPVVRYYPREERVTIGSEPLTPEMHSRDSISQMDSRDESVTIRPRLVDSHVLFDMFVRVYGQPIAHSIPQPLSPGESNLLHEDILKLAEFGLIVTAQAAGSGAHGNVLIGYYGNTAISTFVDSNGNTISGVVLGKRFALKYIDFDVNNTSEKAMKARDAMNMEQSVRKVVDHPNIVPIRLAFSWGKTKFFSTGGKSYQINERVYIVMDFADFGSLDPFCFDPKKQRLDEYYYIKFIVELYSGLKHLHDHHISHCDLHTGNVLVFNEGTEEQPVLTIKLSDFGLSISSGEYLTTPSVSLSRQQQEQRKDIIAMADIVQLFHNRRPIDCSQSLCDIITQLISRLESKECVSLNKRDVVQNIDSLSQMIATPAVKRR